MGAIELGKNLGYLYKSGRIRGDLDWEEQRIKKDSKRNYRGTLRQEADEGTILC
jgi:hypothetical protein